MFIDAKLLIFSTLASLATLAQIIFLDSNNFRLIFNLMHECLALQYDTSGQGNRPVEPF